MHAATLGLIQDVVYHMQYRFSGESMTPMPENLYNLAFVWIQNQISKLRLPMVSFSRETLSHPISSI